MSRPALIAWGMSIALSTAVLWPAGSRARATRSELHRVQTDLASTVAQAKELARLRAIARPAAATDASGGGAALTQSASAVLGACGLPAATLASLAPGGEAPVGGTLPGTLAQARAIRRMATLSLTGLTLPQLGAFLERWRSAEPGWTVASVEITPEPVSPDLARVGGDRPLRVIVGLESLALVEPGEH